MGIIGENVVGGLTQQIKVRQEKLGKTQLDPEDIIYNNSNTSWLRVASSVNVKDSSLANLDNFTFSSPAEGDLFAKNGVLFGPVTNNKGTLPNKALSTNPNLDQQINSHYGWGGGTNLWGQSPPPGIQSLSVQALNRGAIRKANINITAHNPDQFRIIEALYLRLGYTILVEWGHTLYYKNQDKSLHQKKEFSSSAFSSFMNGASFNEINTLINKEKEINDYNYDGFIGYISNFNWTFNPDGTYDINVSIMSRGALIDSLTSNHSSGNEDETDNNSRGEILTSFLEGCKVGLKKITERSFYVESGDKKFRTNANNFDFKYKVELTPPPEPETPPSPQGVEITLASNFSSPSELEWMESLKINKGELIAFNALTESETEQDTDTTQYYITLGLFLRFLKTKCSFYDRSGKPIIDIEHEYGKTFMLSHPFQNSVDPKICFLTSASPSVAGKKDIMTYTSFPAGWLSTGMELSRNNLPFKRDMMSIPLNINFLIKVINNTKSSEGKVTLGALVTEVLDNIRFYTGNINDFSISFDESTNKMIIVDNVTIPGTKTDTRETAKINVYGIGGGGSFVKNLNFTSKIFPSMQNAIAIAAQNSGGGDVGEKVASYSRLNAGLKDRVAKGAQTYNTLTNKSPYENYTNQIHKLALHFNKCYNEGILPDTSTINEMVTPLQDILQSDINRRSQDNEIVPPFYIPIELSLTLKGISGFKLYEKFDITPDYILPPSYPNNINFVIQGISHDVKDNEWSTTLNTLCWPAEQPTQPLTDFIGIIKGSSAEIPQYFTDTNFSPSSPPPPPPPPSIPEPNETPNADRLRAVLKELGYSEKGKELANAGDITREMADYAIAVFRTIKNTTGIGVTVTGGNDLYHQRLPSNSRHKTGRGVDFVITPSNESNVKRIEDILKGFAAGNYSEARYLNEYNNPTIAATGKHFHISWGIGTEAKANIDNAYAEGNAGILTTYKIV